MPSPPPSKRGLTWAWNNPPSYFSLYQPSISSSKITWLFNWEMWAPASLPSGLEYVPQVRLGTQAEQIDTFLTTIQRERGSVPYLLGFNEPDIESQANMSVEEAMRLWKTYILPAKEKFGFRLGAPAISSDPKGKLWLQGFLEHLDGEAGIDFLVLHWYGTNVIEMARYIEDMHATFKMPIWLNEFAFSHMGSKDATTEEVEEFLNQSLPWLDSCEFVERYAYFGAVIEVGDWVGRASSFSEASAIAGKVRLSSVGKTYNML